MLKRDRIRLASNIINLTDEKFGLYAESSGDFARFFPRKEIKLPKVPAKTCRGGRSSALYYVVEYDVYKKIKKSGRKLDDIAVISGRFVGCEKDIKVAHLFWGKDSTITVCLCSNYSAV